MKKNLALGLVALSSALPLGASVGNRTSPRVTSKTTPKPTTTPTRIIRPLGKTPPINFEPESSPTPKSINDNYYNFFSPTFFVAIILISISCVCCLYHGFKRASELRGDHQDPAGNPPSADSAEASAQLGFAPPPPTPSQTRGQWALRQVVRSGSGSDSPRSV